MSSTLADINTYFSYKLFVNKLWFRTDVCSIQYSTIVNQTCSEISSANDPMMCMCVCVCVCVWMLVYVGVCVDA